MTERNIVVNVLPRSKAAERMDIVIKVIQLAVMAYAAWETAKAVNPELAEKERQFTDQVKKNLHIVKGPRPETVTQHQADSFVAQVTKWVRDN